MANVLTEIFRAASKHPNSRVSKLIHQVEEEPTQKNIVLLLIELSDHAEYSIDFNVSLKYYLDLFERCGINHDLVLNEAGLLLVNSSKIYSKRVDYVQSLVERQILTLSNADEELQKHEAEKEQTENSAPTEKPKRGRKRALEAPSDPYEVELAPKKFKKLTEEKRFALPKVTAKAKTTSRNIEMEQHIHPAAWQYAVIYDLDNEEDVDTKRNYKLFTYHIEHRYNTLVPDINFRLHFKVKDYMDEQEEMEEDEACNTDRSWPPLSEAYVQKYLRLENYILEQDMKVNKRKVTNPGTDKYVDAEINDTEPASESQHNLNICETKQSLANENSTELELSVVESNLANLSANLDKESANKTSENLDSSNTEKNDSGLGQSILDESNNTLENSQLNCTLETSQIHGNISDGKINIANDSTLGSSTLEQSSMEISGTEKPESSSTTTNSIEDDSALGSSVLDQTCAENSVTENTESLETSTNQINTSALEITDSENTSSRENKVVENPENVNTTDKENLLDTEEKEVGNNSTNTTETRTENVTDFQTSAIDQISNIENVSQKDLSEANFNETIDFYKDVLKMISDDGEDFNQQYIEELTKATDNRKDSALGDDRLQSSTENLTISTEDLAVSRENLSIFFDTSAENSNIDVIQPQDKDSTQICANLPSADDEGVYLSDLEDQECRFLAPIIKATNILPGVQRKDVTIVLDDELREALEMRDGIMKHFGRETFTVPVITQPTKQSLIFNIFKFPEKQVRRKILFKLGPDMDLYLQARSMRRCRPDSVARKGRNFQLLQWFALNNTDMTGVCMTPPQSPGHFSEFLGFTDDEDDNTTCADFCGFTEEDQSTLKSPNRLSRDSGVGVDVNNLTPDKEPLEIVFEETTNLAKEYCKINANCNKIESEKETTESILEKLRDEIREALTLELEIKSENNVNGNAVNNDALSTLTETSEKENSETQVTENCSTKTTQINTESTETIPSSNNSKEYQINSENSSLINTQESAVTSENCSLINTQETIVVSTENSGETLSCTEQTLTNNETSTSIGSQEKPNEKEVIPESTDNTESLKCSDVDRSSNETSKNSESQDKPSEKEAIHESTDNTESLKCTDVDMPSNETLIIEESNKNIFDNTLDEPSHQFEDHHADDGLNSADDDDILFDLNSQGSKTKIQQWHEHLQPILAQSRERHHFDVYQLGTEIIETVQNKTVPNVEHFEEISNISTASFEDIMEDKDKSYVSRYFLSTLLLANQSNIEILIQNKSSEKPSAWHDINLKLLSTKRHTVAIEDNIGMVDTKQKTRVQNIKQNSQDIRKRPANKQLVDDDEDEPLIKLQSPAIEWKTPLKRSSESGNISCIAEKKPKEILSSTPTNNQFEKLPTLIQNVQIIKPPFVTSIVDTPVLPSTSRQAQQKHAPFFNVNMNSVRTLQPIEKVHKRSDDYDSGIFSVDEMSTHDDDSDFSLLL